MTPHMAWLRCSIALTLIAGCSSALDPNPAPLSPSNVNLIFVVSEDLAFHAPGDINPSTSNLTDQGLQRSLQLATFLKQKVLGTNNVTRIYALMPTTHLQTASAYPDMVALETIEHFALLNQTTLSSDLTGGTPYAGQNSPIYVSYAAGSVPAGVAVPAQFCPNCQGLDFADTGGDNEALVSGIVTAAVPGFYVFSAPWETVSGLLSSLDQIGASHLSLPAGYEGPNNIYAVSMLSSGTVNLTTYDSNLVPPSSYPDLPPPALSSAACTPPTPSTIEVTGGIGGAVIPAGANTNETLYIVRHAEAHPQGYWSDNNYIGAGQWRALSLPNALQGKIDPDQVWSGDPSAFTIGTVDASGDHNWSGVAPQLTVEPYAIANNLPFHLISTFDLFAVNSAQLMSNAFFTGGTFSNHKVLLGWMAVQNTQLMNALLASYFPNGGAPAAPVWSAGDYDSLWVVTLDAHGNVTLDFTQCEGINSATLPATAPSF